MQTSDFDPTQLPGLKIVDGRRLSQEFIDSMVEARKNAPPEVNFVEQMRERKRNGTPKRSSSSDGSEETPYKYYSSAEGS